MASKKENNIPLNDLLTRGRNQYIRTLQAGINQQKTTKSATEVLLRDKKIEKDKLPEIYQLNRYDLINIIDGNKHSVIDFDVDRDSMFIFNEQVYNVNGMTVRIRPFVWSRCEFYMSKKPNDTFERWAQKWIDVDDKTFVDTNALQGVIHSIKLSKISNNKWKLVIDFGSASISAFNELLDMSSKQGIESLEVCSKFDIH